MHGQQSRQTCSEEKEDHDVRPELRIVLYEEEQEYEAQVSENRDDVDGD